MVATAILASTEARVWWTVRLSLSARVPMASTASRANVSTCSSVGGGGVRVERGRQ